MTFFQALRHSLAARVLGVFLVTGVAVLLVITLAWGVAMKHQWNTKIRAHLLQYIDYVNNDIGTPPDPQRADELAQLVPVNIYIKGPGIDYSSTGLALDLSELLADIGKIFLDLCHLIRHDAAGQHRRDEGEREHETREMLDRGHHADLLDAELAAPIATPGGFVVAIGHRALFAVRDRTKSARFDTETGQIVANRSRSALTQGQVVFDGTALIAVPLDDDLETRVQLEDARVVLQHSPGHVGQV